MTRFDSPCTSVRGYRPAPHTFRPARRPFRWALAALAALALLLPVWLLAPRAVPDAQTFAMPEQTAAPHSAFVLPSCVR